MSEPALVNRSLADQVFEQLATAILAGQYTPGAALPGERSMTETFGVNRHVIREAVKRLAQVGFVKVSPGGRTKVLDFKQHAGLDLLAILADHGSVGKDEASIWLSMMEMRATIAEDAARLCAQRGSDELKRDLVALAQRVSTAEEPAALELDAQFWDRVVDGSANVAYRLAYNSLLKSSHALGERAREWSRLGLLPGDVRLKIARAVAAGNAKRAESETRRALRAITRRCAEEVRGRAVTEPVRRQ